MQTGRGSTSFYKLLLDQKPSTTLLNTEIIQKIRSSTGAQSVIRSSRIQSLWSGYGEIIRCELAGGKLTSVVVKHVQLPNQLQHPRGWNTDISHQRKLKSYEVEMNWYAGLAQHCDTSCRIPTGIYNWQQEGEMLMILEDLDTAGFPVRKSSVTLDEIKSCLSWLAHFHAKFMDTTASELWSIGTYWHLDTRPDEWLAMQNQHLKNAAKTIDTKLKNAIYQTLVHGDAKLANFCFASQHTAVAAVDFQYVGRGCGMKDVAYLLSSCLDESECEILEHELLNYYFSILRSAFERYEITLNPEGLIHEWSELYKYAWADFYRFLDGWSPGHYKMHRYSQRMVNEVMADIRR
ncbi:DUF1679 domain-containing protein [Reichenbachiella agarivorans]|uniref:DUF1679 domain-containing protein n=1 Tax=Reichenbachiella agarivorans TaxID=2979464 RepID=A0ABY6CLZ8_9BACT|nr:oxidoreductase family protein [Reichenbachiella agarivorans]UXP31539.1 DUF1679 domain-containing protein [Reichenbachiella agarivorans]